MYGNCIQALHTQTGDNVIQLLCAVQCIKHVKPIRKLFVYTRHLDTTYSHSGSCDTNFRVIINFAIRDTRVLTDGLERDVRCNVQMQE